jgi:ATP-binding cassette subfamily F protein 3
MLILDEPTNHLDVDAREALVQALNEYSGAVVIVSHDRHMLELTADRLVLVDGGTAREFDGSSTIISPSSSRRKARAAKSKANKKEDRKAAAEAREKAKVLRQALKTMEADVTRLTAERSALDAAMFDPSTAPAALSSLPMSVLMKRRADVAASLETAEAKWLEASETLDGTEAN